MRNSQRGYSLVEMVVAVAIILTGTAVAMLSASTLGPTFRANAAMATVIAQLRAAREQALAQRRNIQVQFIGNNQIRLTRFDLPAGTTVLSTIPLNSPVQFTVFANMPDTPENFGNGSAIAFGGTPLTTFLSDGTFVDASGQPLNGTIFFGIPGKESTARAVTVLGATGRVHSYRWDGTAWAQ